MKYLAMMLFVAAFALMIYEVAMLKPIAAKEDIMTRVAVIDTGFNHTKKSKDITFCNTLDKSSYSNNDVMGHGTIVTQLIYDSLTKERKTTTCFMVLSIMDAKQNITSTSIATAVLNAILQKATIINMSIQHDEFSFALYNAMKLASDSGITVFVAAGNWGANLNGVCNVYPACFRDIKNMYVVGQYSRENRALPQQGTNFGVPVMLWYDGVNGTDTGTSISTARAMADYVNNL